MKMFASLLAALTLACTFCALARPSFADPRPGATTSIRNANPGLQVKQTTQRDDIGDARDARIEPGVTDTSKSKTGDHEAAPSMPVHQRTWTATPFRLTPSGSDDGKQKSDKP